MRVESRRVHSASFREAVRVTGDLLIWSDEGLLSGAVIIALSWSLSLQVPDLGAQNHDLDVDHNLL
jgi:hypothetical protein